MYQYICIYGHFGVEYNKKICATLTENPLVLPGQYMTHNLDFEAQF